MATRRTDRPNLWNARVTHNNVRYFLGNFPTRRDAEVVEREFRKQKELSKFSTQELHMEIARRAARRG